MNDLGYRQLHTVDARRSRVRSVFVVIGTALAALVFWFLVMVLVFVVKSPCALCVR